MTSNYVNENYLHSDITARIIAAAQRVHAELGPGFREVIYQRALALELMAEGLDYSREVWIDVHYRDQVIGKQRVDFFIEEVMVEIKARSELLEQDFVQTLSYLKASGFKVALLLNFGAKQLGIRRLVHNAEMLNNR